MSWYNRLKAPPAVLNVAPAHSKTWRWLGSFNENLERVFCFVLYSIRVFKNKRETVFYRYWSNSDYGLNKVLFEGFWLTDLSCILMQIDVDLIDRSAYLTKLVCTVCYIYWPIHFISSADFTHQKLFCQNCIFHQYVLLLESLAP